jgi:hypothetical protein
LWSSHILHKDKEIKESEIIIHTLGSWQLFESWKAVLRQNSLLPSWHLQSTWKYRESLFLCCAWLILSVNFQMPKDLHWMQIPGFSML